MSQSLTAQFGEYVELSEHEEPFRIALELTVGGIAYAVLQSTDEELSHEIEIFRIVTNEAGEPLLETVEDDEEWEQVSEAYDDAHFGQDDLP